LDKDEIKKNRILEYAAKCFMSLGYTNVSMDDIARGVGMGKGTVYKIFPSKEVLFLNTIELYVSNIEKEINVITSDENRTPVEKLNLFLKTLAEKISIINPEILLSIQRNFPETYEKVNEIRQNIIITNIIRLLQEGKKIGLYDPAMDEWLVAQIMIGAVERVSNSKILSQSKCSPDQIFRAVTSVIFKGCMTEEGRKKAFSDME